MTFKVSEIRSIYHQLERQYARANVFRTPRLEKVVIWIAGLALLGIIILLGLGHLRPSWRSGLIGPSLMLLLLSQLSALVLAILQTLPILKAVRELKRRPGGHLQYLLETSAKYAEIDFHVAEALSQSNESALRFVENLPRRGYEGRSSRNRPHICRPGISPPSKPEPQGGSR